MGFSINPFHHNTVDHHNLAIPSGTMIALTEDGKKAVDNGQVSGREAQILMSLGTVSSMSINNLARESHMNSNEVEMQVKRLRSQGYVNVRSYENEN